MRCDDNAESDTLTDLGVGIAAGHNAFIKGTLEAREVSEAEARHYAEDAGKPKEEIERIVGPQKSVMMIATGVMISDGEKLDPPVQ